MNSMGAMPACSTFAIATLAAIVGPGCVAAQPGQDVQLRNDCRLAQQVLVHGQPANKLDWALGVINGCGPEGADVLATLLRENRSAAARSPTLDRVADRATMIVDSAIFNAALSVATDLNAGEAARIHALSVLYTQLTRAYRPYGELVQSYASETIILEGPTTAGPLNIRILPADAHQRALELLREVARTEMNPLVREAARRVCAGIEPRGGRCYLEH